MDQMNHLNKTRFVLEIQNKNLKVGIQGFTLPTLTADGPKVRTSNNKMGAITPDTLDLGILNCRYLSDSTMTIYDELYKWMLQSTTENIKDVVIVHILDSKCVKPIFTITFHDAYPSTLDGLEFEYTEDSITPSIGSVTISYRKLNMKKV